METFAHNPFMRITHKSLACILAFCMVNLPVWALDFSSSNGTSGPVAIPGGTGIEVLQNRSIIEWNNFNTDPGELLRFFQGSNQDLTSAYAVLNRVIGGDMTQFNGILQGGQGHILIINPKGVTIGSTAAIEAGRFTASSLNITDPDFLGSVYKFTGDGVGDIHNYGNISAEQVALIGQNVLNAGTITTGSGGIVVMAAGENIYLGEPGGKIIVEMTGIEGGMVTNAGIVDAPDGTIIMAAGDIYSIPLHPQLQVDGNGDALTGDTYPVRVETGSGTVVQEGSIDAGTGSIVLTAGDEVILVNGSQTAAMSGKVVAYAYDLDNNEASTIFQNGAQISIGDGFAAISGNHILFAGDIDAALGGTIQTSSETLTIADILPVTGPEFDTLYEKEHVEFYSKAGVNLDLAAEELITVEYMSDGVIWGGSGDIMLRNIFDTGGIYFEANPSGDRTTLRTTAGFETGGGNIFMISGSGGIVAGDLFTNKLANDKISNPGRIRIQSSNGGDIAVGSMIADGGNISEISAISSGSLTVNGPVMSINKVVPKAEKEIGFARVCLVANEDVVIDAERGSISVISHGKFNAVGDIIICAGGDVTIHNLGKDGINAYAQTSENTGPQAALVNVDIVAGGNKTGAGVILINGTTYDSSPGADNSGLPVFLETKVSGAGTPLRIDTSDPAVAGDDGELIWQDTQSVEDNYAMGVRLTINNDSQFAPGDLGSPCYDCPVPPGLPPVPVIFWLVDDDFDTSWRSGNIAGFDPAALDVLANDNGLKGDSTAQIVNYSVTTAKGGTLEMVWIDDLGAYGFLYTPPTDQPFDWDGISNFASFTDTFEYQATKEVNGQTVLSKNTATVEIVVTNYLPVLYAAEDTIHMNDTSTFNLETVFELPGELVPNTVYIVDQDGTPGDMPGTYGELNYGIVHGDIPVIGGTIATGDTLSITDETISYQPLDGYVSPADSPTTFGYSVTDSSIIGGTVELEDGLAVTVTNTLPGGTVTLDDAPMNADGVELDVFSGDFIDDDGDAFSIISIEKATDDFNKTFGGTLDYNGSNNPYVSDDSYTYTADADLPGYVGPDTFDVKLWDGQKTYYLEDGLLKSTPDYGDGTIALTVTNDLPSGTVTLENASMNAVNEELAVVSGNFTDANGDLFSIEDIAAAIDDENMAFGGTLDYNGDVDPYAAGDSYNYSADPLLPGYTGQDNFDVTLWDGQMDYAFKEIDGVWVVDTENTTKVYGSGTIELLVTNELPGGDAWFGQVHMDSQNVTQDLASGFGEGVTVSDGTWTGSVIGSDLYGGTLVYDGETWTYSTDTTLPGYVGDDNDTYGQPGYVADDLFTVNLSSGAGQQYDYWFSEDLDLLPDGYEYYEPADLYRKAVSGTGTVSVDITNQLPTFGGDLGDVHMNTPVAGINLLDYANDLDDDTLYFLVNGEMVALDDFISGNNIDASQIVYDGTDWTFTPADGYVGPESFTVVVWDGQINYVFNENGTINTELTSKETVSGQLTVTTTNTLPTFGGDLGDVHMNTPVAGINLLDYANDADSDTLYVLVNGEMVALDDFISGNNIDASQIVYDGTDWTFTPADGYVGPESFTVVVWDGQYDYVDGVKGDKVTVSGQLTVTTTNIKPTAEGDLGSFDLDDGPIIVIQDGVVSPVAVNDEFDPQQTAPDDLSIIPGVYTGSNGGTLEFDGTNWIYNPAQGFSGTETFDGINVWDGQNIYENGELIGPEYGQGTVSVTVTAPEVIPAAPLPLLEIPKLVGCPVLLEAAANELAVNSDELQLLIANAMATNPNLQPCDACENLLEAASALKGINPEIIAAMNLIFNNLAPLDTPFTPEASASVRTAFANFRDMEPQLAIMSAEQHEQYQQYMLADEVIEAFVSYVAVLDNDLKLPVGDAMALVIDKYFEPIEASGNPNIGAYIIEQIIASQSTGEPIVASAD